jgi:hypothetical protein
MKLSEHERKALVIHGYIVIGIPNDFLSRTSFYQRTAYQIGDNVYSLDDIEHGIIRGIQKLHAQNNLLSANRKHPGFYVYPQFSGHDSRKQFALTTFDPRIHFALVCGARSCPPIRVYNSNNLETALNLASTNFCQDEANVKVSGNMVVE